VVDHGAAPGSRPWPLAANSWLRPRAQVTVGGAATELRLHSVESGVTGKSADIRCESTGIY
jgi:hypothetical protein